MANPAIEGNGISLQMGTSNWAPNINTLTMSGASRADIDNTHLGITGGKLFDPGKTYDPGTIDVGAQFDTATAPPFDQPKETVTVTMPLADSATNSTQATLSADGYLNNSDMISTGENDAQTDQSVTIKLSGNLTFTAEAI